MAITYQLFTIYDIGNDIPAIIPTIILPQMRDMMKTPKKLKINGAGDKFGEDGMLWQSKNIFGYHVDIQKKSHH